MTWAPVKLQWPAEATSWMDDIAQGQELAAAQLAGASERLSQLQALASTDLSTIGAAVQGVIGTGRAALDAQFGEVPQCIVVTPFQSGVGEGTGYQRYLSAPNVLQRLADKLQDGSDPQRPAGEQYALVLLFLGTRYDGLASTLSTFNALMPIPDLQRAERRAGQIFRLEAEKWELPTAGALPRWAALPLERCTVLKAASQAMTSQIAQLESYAADSSPLSDLAQLAQRKAQQTLEHSQTLTDLQDLLANGSPDASMQARLVGPGDPAELRRQILEGADAPGHEWALSSGLMLVGSLPGLGFVRELVGL